MALYLNTEQDGLSKKNKARQDSPFLQSFSNLGDDFGLGVEDFENPDFGLEEFETRVSREVPQDDDVPQNARSFLTDYTTIQDIISQRNPGPEKPQKDTERQDQYKKYAMAKGIGELVKAIGDSVNAAGGGINAQGTQSDIPFAMQQIMNIDQQYMNEMKDYRNQLMRNDELNRRQAGDVAGVMFREREAAKDREVAQNQFEGKQKQFLLNLQNANDQEERDRILRKYIADLNQKGDQADRQYNYDRLGYLQGQQSRDDLRTQGTLLNNTRKQLENRLSEVIDDREKAEILSQIQGIDNDLNAVNEALSQITGAKYEAPEQEPSPGGLQPGLLGAAQQQYQQSQRPPVSPGSSQIDNTISDEKPKKTEEIVSQTDNLLKDVLKTKKVSRDNLRVLINAFEDRAEATDSDFDKQGFVEYLESEGVEINLAQDDLDKILSSIDKLFTRKTQDNTASR